MVTEAIYSVGPAVPSHQLLLWYEEQLDPKLETQPKHMGTDTQYSSVPDNVSVLLPN
jgi:hypothetical protein